VTYSIAGIRHEVACAVVMMLFGYEVGELAVRVGRRAAGVGMTDRNLCLGEKKAGMDGTVGVAIDME
jgi:hypothetical protein